MRNKMVSLDGGAVSNGYSQPSQNNSNIPLIGHTPTRRTAFEDALGAEHLSAHLAEYQWLRTEIQSRSDYQHRIIQIHVAALTLLLTTGLAGSFSKWIILAIPFESAIFGLWWLDHATTIRKIGRYLADELEEKIDQVLGSTNVVTWERRVENPDQHDLKSVIKGYQSVSDWTFIWPSGLILFVTALGALVTSKFWSTGGWRGKLADAYTRFFPLANEFEGYRPWILLGSAIVGTLMFVRYIRKYREFGHLVHE